MSALGPREVEPDAWGEWAREALRLLLHRPALTVVVLALVLVIFYAVHLVEWGPVRVFLMLLCLPLALMVFIRLAWYADHSRRPWPSQLLPGNGELLLSVGCAAAAMALHGGLATVTAPLADGFVGMVQQLGLWSPVQADGLPAQPPLRHTLLGPVLVPGGLFGVALVGMLLMLLAFGQWFLLPMMALHNPPLPPAMAASARAYPLNPAPMMGVTGLLMLAAALLLVTVGWILIALLPFFGALLYVGYRDVFLGSESDAPEGIAVDDELGEGSHG
ncbi:hypothetical protein [Aquisalimonas asiatica]|uniref:Transmembrane protein n=1 Tax=Aquisalimonas asiatica TaxID=406100 RepID=A0A1H8PR48_9GAMM|nr:hypothetical protein [Aquisalimonas asiatica]SEO44509.1 hypothetical protein SAMN04488052_101110 [Aquisalimonas asiatica]